MLLRISPVIKAAVRILVFACEFSRGVAHSHHGMYTRFEQVVRHELAHDEVYGSDTQYEKPKAKPDNIFRELLRLNPPEEPYVYLFLKLKRGSEEPDEKKEKCQPLEEGVDQALFLESCTQLLARHRIRCPEIMRCHHPMYRAKA